MGNANSFFHPIKKDGSVLLPDYLASSVLAINQVILHAQGIRKLVFDVDETLVPRKGNVLPDKYVVFLKSLKQSGFDLYIGSNAKRDLSALSASVGAVWVPPTATSFKPLHSYFKSVSKITQAKPEQTCMIGDRLLNDVIGANRAHFTTILVSPVKRRPHWLYQHYYKWVLHHVS